MKEMNYIIQDASGIHARPAGMLAKEAGALKSTIMLSNGIREVDMKRMMAVMSLAIKQGQEVQISISGEDEEEALSVIEAFFKKNL